MKKLLIVSTLLILCLSGCSESNNKIGSIVSGKVILIEGSEDNYESEITIEDDMQNQIVLRMNRNDYNAYRNSKGKNIKVRYNKHYFIEEIEFVN